MVGFSLTNKLLFPQDVDLIGGRPLWDSELIGGSRAAVWTSKRAASADSLALRTLLLAASE
jgi:hypothetical protein